MDRRIRSKLAAGALAVAALTVTAMPVAAFPPPGEPPDRPPPTRPSTTTPPAPPPTAPRQFESLVVTTDSVVATATIRYNGSPGIVTVSWGDGTTSSRNPDDPIDSPRPTPNPDPPGTIVFKHAYAAPGDGAPFAASITAQMRTDSRGATVTVIPRYRVTQYQASLETLYRCDSVLEQHTEWRIVRRGGSLADKTWEFDLVEPTAWVGEFPGQTRPLPDSIVSFDVTAADRKQITYQVTEVDLFIDNLGQTHAVDLDPLLGSRPVVLEYHDFGGCWARLHADVNVALLTPGLGSGGGGGPIAHQ